jgi:signal transduction histidine kinase
MHQCSYARDWARHEARLLREIGQRLTDALTNLLHTQALRESEANFRAIAENARVGILITAADGTRVYGNRDAVALIGCAPEEIGERVLDDLLGDRSPGTHEAALRRPDGTTIPVEATATTTNWHGRDASLVLLRDIRERKALEAERARLLDRELRARVEAERANHAKDEFLAIVSHELRTPLTTIVTWAQMLRRGTCDEALARKAIDTIARAAAAQGQIIDDLLDVTRSASGKLSLDLRPVDPAAVALATVESLRPMAEKKSIAISFEAVQAARRLPADAARLQQVFANLIGNAIKFTPSGGRIEARLCGDEDGCCFTVRDTGQGIPESLLSHIFDPFAQVDGSSTRVHGGLGLGLSIVRSIVELHGGRVRAESQGPGQGATFTVHLPASAPGA